MQLDRNTNRGGRGKYALVNMRKLIPLLEAKELADRTTSPDHLPSSEAMEVLGAFELLLQQGIITLGNETPGDQFFVMKYKDKFTADALQAYAGSAQLEAQYIAHSLGDKKRGGELMEYANQIGAESIAARELGNRIPD